MATTTSKPGSTPRSLASTHPDGARLPRLTAISLVLAVAGTGVAAYLTSVHYDDALLLCGVGNCETVQQSKYAEIAGIPVALLGLLMYLALAALGLLRWRRPDVRPAATTLAFAVALAGTIYAAYLTYLEIWVIDAICQWCVTSAILTLGILVVESVAVWRVLGVTDS
ncbi:MAG TPA: vitamin K epoxide reductase family protein [Thermomicrobiales bacterium]|jgi:uncharacterized membrane protein